MPKPSEIMEYCAAHDWFKRHFKLLSKNKLYLEIVCAEMREDTEPEMNRAILSIPFEIRTSAIVPELITNFLVHQRRIRARSQ